MHLISPVQLSECERGIYVNSLNASKHARRTFVCIFYCVLSFKVILYRFKRATAEIDLSAEIFNEMFDLQVFAAQSLAFVRDYLP